MQIKVLSCGSHKSTVMLETHDCLTLTASRMWKSANENCNKVTGSYFQNFPWSPAISFTVLQAIFISSVTIK